ncbi:hypothetical protein G9A89_019057 [Geosiphon pyriformis]|nr:hypothetical protein G9A89_019057 [Geosiphon pyriformis]
MYVSVSVSVSVSVFVCVYIFLSIPRFYVGVSKELCKKMCGSEFQCEMIWDSESYMERLKTEYGRIDNKVGKQNEQ